MFPSLENQAHPASRRHVKKAAHAWLKTLTAVAAPLALSACAVVSSPGFDFSDTGPRSSVSLDPHAPDGAADGQPARPLIHPITPELVRSFQTGQVAQIPQEVTGLYAEPQPYTIGVSDVISIVVYDHPELLPMAGSVISQQVDPTGISPAPGFIVEADGTVFFPYIGKVEVAGLTQTEASQLITQRLARYIKDPQVTVRTQSFRSKRVYVEGQVADPGMQIFTDVPMSLPEAINRAGGLTPLGDRSEVLLTREGRTTRIDLGLLERLGGDPNRILLHNGDNVRVRNREDKKIYVLGESFKPSALLMQDGHLSLAQALGEAGGVNPTTADPGQIYVIRNQPDGSPGVYHLDAKNPVALALADNFALQPRDVVYIDPVPLVRWNRIISLILPTASVLNTGSEISTR